MYKVSVIETLMEFVICACVRVCVHVCACLCVRESGCVCAVRVRAPSRA